MHIPDGFLSTPVWATLDAAAIPAVGYIASRAQRKFDDARIPLLGVMGAFVFAAQMMQFPVGLGTSGHLVGGALLAFTLGPSAATIVMAAIIVTQALVFQDGGILALGPNVMNMAVAGVLAGYLPFYLWGNGRWRKAAIFAGGAVSVLTSALLALGELLLSGVRMPASILGVSVALFAVSAILEGAITLTVIQALESIQPGFVRRPAARRPFAVAAVAAVAFLMAAVGVMFAATNPDGIQRLGEQTGISGHATSLISTPLSGYQIAFLQSGWSSKATAGIAGLVLIYCLCALIGRKLRRRSA